MADARRIARGLAARIGLDENLAEQVAIVVTEASTNLLKHAGGGELLLRTTGDVSAAKPCLEMLALDKGAGMGNLEQCMRDGFSTGGSAGQGLGAIVRLSTEADFYSEAGRGAAVMARWSDPAPPREPPQEHSLLQIGVVNVCKPGQDVCGDSWGATQKNEFTTILVADGLGHGINAKTASAEAVRMLHLHPDANPGALVEFAHQALRSSRGAAVAVARIDRSRNEVVFSGIGNISGHIYGADRAAQRMVSGYGTAGFQAHRVKEFRYAWPESGILVMFSDGLGSQAGLETHTGLARRDPSLIAGVLYRDFSRHNDDATVLVAKAI